jgi:hypothetical protein
MRTRNGVASGSSVLRWEDAGHTGIVVEGCVPGDAADRPAQVPEFVRQCALPIVVFSGAHAAVRGTATLVRSGEGVFLLTAAHLFDDGVRLDDLALPLPSGRDWVALGSARLIRDADADIALVVPARAQQAVLAGAWHAVPLAAVADAGHALADQAVHYVAGYPAQMTRRSQEWLAAKRLVVTTARCPAPDGAAPGARGRDLFLEYRRVAARTDGVSIHTPELDGVSGAAVWSICRLGGRRHLMIVGVQSAFRHSRYMRAHRMADLATLRRGMP